VSWLGWVEPWYSAYGLTGVMMLGVAPMLIPLTVAHYGGGPTAVGVVVAAFFVGGLFAPMIGSVADRSGRQRQVFLLSFPVMAVAVAAFGFVRGAPLWALCAVIFGTAGPAVGTIAGLFIVEGHPRSEWNDRISWFRLAYGAGQTLGLLVAAATVHYLRLGWLVTAVLLLAGTVVGRIGIPRLGPVAGPVSLHPTTSARPIGAISWMLHAFQRVNLSDLPSTLTGRFGVFLIAWLLTMTGIQTFFDVVPLVMSAFAVSASASSLLFLAGAAVGTLVFPLCGKLADKRGPGTVFAIGLLITIAAFAAMTAAAVTQPSWKGVVGSLALVFAAIAYSFVVVAATMLVVRLTPGTEGSAMGLLNALIAAGAVIGAIVPSFLAEAFGYAALPAMATAVVTAALVVALPLIRSQPPKGLPHDSENLPVDDQPPA
jgi:MFS family permease